MKKINLLDSENFDREASTTSLYRLCHPRWLVLSFLVCLLFSWGSGASKVEARAGGGHSYSGSSSGSSGSSSGSSSSSSSSSSRGSHPISGGDSFFSLTTTEKVVYFLVSPLLFFLLCIMIAFTPHKHLFAWFKRKTGFFATKIAKSNTRSFKSKRSCFFRS